MMDPIQPNNEEDVGPSTQAETRLKKKGRGSTTLPHISRSRTGMRRKIKYNQKGQPVGPIGTEFISYLGVLARNKVPISYKEWRKVPKELKDELWSSVELRYELDPKSKKYVIASIGEKWRTFKTNLTRLYVIPFKDQPNLLSHPPEIYSFIKQEHWDAFVRSRISEGFQKLRQAQMERRAKNLYNHCVSRKGYTGLEEEIKRKSGKSDKLDRSVLWKKARQNKEGEYVNDSVKEAAARIDELTQLTQEGKVTIEGSNDILSMALGTPEHSSRVRAVGHFVTPKVYFHLPRREQNKYTREMEEEHIALESQIKETAQLVLQLQTQLNAMERQEPLTTPISENVDLNSNKSDDRSHPMVGPQLEPKLMKTKDDMLPLDLRKKSKSCRLVLGLKKKSVAYGMVFDRVGTDEKIHNVPLGESNVRVAVDYVVCPDALLPIPAPDEMTKVGDAIGSHVAWPKDLILIDDEEAAKQVHGSDNLVAIQAFAEYVSENMSTDGTINIPIEHGIFEQDMSAFIHKDDIIALCEMGELTSMCIVIYISHLYRMIEFSNLQEKYGFANPATICGPTRATEGLRVFENRLKTIKDNQLLFVPYNTAGHWILIVLDLSSVEAYWLDPLQRPIRMNVQLIINTCFRTFRNLVGKGIKKNLDWKVIKCPKQPTNVESGYYILRYMKELIDDQSQPITVKFNRKDTYTQDELDEVRVECISIIEKFLD